MMVTVMFRTLSGLVQDLGHDDTRDGSKNNHRGVWAPLRRSARAMAHFATSKQAANPTLTQARVGHSHVSAARHSQMLGPHTHCRLLRYIRGWALRA